ncbi:MAG: acetylglutamate kinase [Chloroflexota bacterium]|nr:acetylglutamate kinase [Dehalococcoidia bacterium]MEC8959372.1 acetylglutamate kinase [Chloroflexota bacterium]PKB62557.1 MAG: acetylglutamate kinase [SAR202 cluster bacterium Ae2-Chloro-G3]MEC9447340.1 acetylglutamate kinase [Chloroflexota bacterium]MED5405603.1 acetylglutamate kinase [Chloroflexota bacterium]
MAVQPTSGHPIVVKIGGSTLGSHDTSLRDLVALQEEGQQVVVVHGGGNVISQWMQRQGLAPQFVGGLRVTDAPSLEIVVAVLGGLINKELVSLMYEFGGRSVGLSGIDGCMVEAEIGNPELGFVGEVTNVNVDLIRVALDSGFIPMIAPLGVHVRDGSENAGSPLNINGDTVAGELARALEAQQLVFLTDVAGVMDGGGRVIRRLDRRRANILFNSGVIQGGMIPKLSACLRALEQSPVANIIDGRQPNALLECIRGNSTGTTIVGDFRSARRKAPPSP